MKKWVFGIALALLLTGCAAQETFETVLDNDAAAVFTPVREIRVVVPGDAAMCVMQNDDAEKLYLCDGYAIAVLTLPGGDLDATVKTLTGFGRDEITLIETAQDSLARYDFVWSCMGETGEQVCRGAILDDGGSHYCLTAMTDADQTEAVRAVWEAVFESFFAA